MSDTDDDADVAPAIDLPAKTLTADLVSSHISLLARTGNGLSHAYTRLEIHDEGLTDVNILESYPHLRYIDLSLNALDNITALNSLEYLLALDLHSNHLRNIPAALDKKKYLQHVNLARNKIERFEVTSWPLCAWLNLNENNLPSLALPDFSSLLHLEARSNVAKSVSPLVAPKLQKLYLGNNPLEKLSNIDLEGKPFLQLLHLRECGIKSLETGKGVMEGLRSLIYLNLRDNKIQSPTQIDHLQPLSRLKILVLMGNPIDQHPSYRLEIIHRLPKLERLDKDPVTEEEREEAEQYRLQLEREKAEAAASGAAVGEDDEGESQKEGDEEGD
ncbi:hypothetical protein SpCBS45565_g01582 [Spizellomyces sp. 'palustris']|nr:hypothetical protein SpCBS45565_g01582 [Spizellomyces sp. 'palustris']